jgi:hypothetical protein
MEPKEPPASRGYLEAAVHELRRLKGLGEKALAQVEDRLLNLRLDPESNSLALIVKHLAGNMLSRWTDFLVSDGEKPWRHRDQEFETPQPLDRGEMLAAWDAGWACLFTALAGLGEDDLSRLVRIRGEALSVTEAINRQVSHYAYHVGQLVFLAKHLAGSRWTSLSIPRGQSAGHWPYRPDPPARGST